MAVRSFNGTSSRITTSVGNVVGFTGPGTWVFVIKPADVVDGALIYISTLLGADVAYSDIFSGTHHYALVAGERNLDAIAVVNGWQVLVVGKTAGTTAPTWSKCVMGTGVWTHGTAASTLADNAVGLLANGVIQFGAYRASEWWNGYLAAAAYYSGQLTNLQRETLNTGIPAWMALSPSDVWRFNQASTATPVVDLVGSANQVVEANTTVVNGDDPPGFSFASVASPVAAVASGTGAVNTARVALSAMTTTANGSGSAGAAAANIQPQAGAATVAGTAATPTVAIVTSAGSATGSAVAGTVASSIGVTPSVGTASGDAATPAPSVAPTASTSMSGGAASNATADEGSDTDAAARIASGSGAAYAATVVSQGRRSQMVDGPCNWEIDTGCCSGWDDFDDATQEIAYHLATTTLWAATGRRFGRCPITVQPCGQRRKLPLYETFPVPGWGYGQGYSGQGGFGVFMEDGQWFNGCFGGCRCRARCEIALDGPTTTDGVLSVSVDGVVVSPAAYQIQNGYLLVRIDGQCWPTCADYSEQNPPAFEVIYLRGNEMPPALAIAGGILACEFAKACVEDDSCRLPARLTSLTRQGVSVQVAAISSYLDLGLTEIPEVDRVIVNLNPYRQQERSRVLSPDTPRPRMVT